MATITISLPDDVKDYVEAQLGDEFSDAGEFLAELVRRDQEQRLAELRRIVDDARANGVSSRTVDQIFDAAVERARVAGKLRE